MTRVTFSDDGDIVFRLPCQWSNLTNREVRTVYRFMAVTPRDELPIVLFGILTNMRVNRCEPDKTAVSFLIDGKTVNTWIDNIVLSELSKKLEFVFDPGDYPVRSEYIDGRRAVDRCFHGLTFGEYIRIESLYQGYITSKNAEALVRIANILYRHETKKKEKPITELRQWQSLMIISWVTQVKSLFASTFDDFFKPAAGEVEAPAMLEIIDNEIRALTGGDVSKEKEILEIDCWRALTELNFKAREAEEYNRRMAKVKS